MAVMSSSIPAVIEVPVAAPGRSILAVDYGRKRMGLALSDALGLTARPLAICTRSNRRGDITRLREICRRHTVGTIIVGWPLHLDGSASEMGQEAARFAERLRKNLGLAGAPGGRALEQLGSAADAEGNHFASRKKRCGRHRRSGDLTRLFVARAPRRAGPHYTGLRCVARSGYYFSAS